MNKLMVMFVETNEIEPTECYPPVGTVGEVLDEQDGLVMVQWPNGTTSDDGKWWVETSRVQRVFI